MSATLIKGRRIGGQERGQVLRDLAARYGHGESIRALAASTGRSYGFVRNILVEAGVVFRERGGARPRRRRLL